MCSDVPEKGLFWLGYAHPLRALCIRLHKNAYFNGFVLAVIIANCVTLAMSSAEPGFDLTPTGLALTDLDTFFTSVFLVEMVVKVRVF